MIRILALKNWQLFFMTIVPGIFGNVISKNFVTQIALGFVIGLIFFAWLFSIGVSLRKLFLGKSKIEIVRFKLILSYIVSYMLVSAILLSLDFTFTLPWIILHAICLILLVLLVIDCAMVINSISKSRGTLELFLLIWFFPIGIWFIQPELNSLVKTDK